MLGDIIFVKTSSPISWLIRKVSGGKFSHICISMNDENTVILEADVFQRLSVKRNPYTSYQVVDVDMSDSQRLQLLYFILGKYGAKYDYYYVLGMGLKLLGLVKDSVGFDRRNRWMCSEIIDEAFKHVGIDLIPNKTDGNVSPSELANALIKEK